MEDLDDLNGVESELRKADNPMDETDEQLHKEVESKNNNFENGKTFSEAPEQIHREVMEKNREVSDEFSYKINKEAIHNEVKKKNNDFIPEGYYNNEDKNNDGIADNSVEQFEANLSKEDTLNTANMIRNIVIILIIIVIIFLWFSVI